MIFEEFLLDFYEELANSQQNLPVEIKKTLYQNLFDLYEDNMSAKTDAKIKQNYSMKLKMCSNCNNLKFNEVNRGLSWATGVQLPPGRTKLRCGIGGFAVKKMATCSLHVFEE